MAQSSGLINLKHLEGLHVNIQCTWTFKVPVCMKEDLAAFLLENCGKENSHHQDYQGMH